MHQPPQQDVLHVAPAIDKCGDVNRARIDSVYQSPWIDDELSIHRNTQYFQFRNDPSAIWEVAQRGRGCLNFLQDLKRVLSILKCNILKYPLEVRFCNGCPYDTIGLIHDLAGSERSICLSSSNISSCSTTSPDRMSFSPWEISFNRPTAFLRFS